MSEPPGPIAPRAIARAVQVLLHGGLVGFPTETVYGLGADADRRDAVEAIFRAKGRPADHPLIVHVAQTRAADAWAREIGAPARLLMQRFWPGPLTLILPRSARAQDVVTGGQDTVGLRCPASPWAQALLEAFCEARGDFAAAIAAPSANRYGRISPTCAAHVRDDLGEKPSGAVDYILDGGPCTLGIESTIVEAGADRVRVLRPGSIGAGDLAAVLGRPVDVAAADENAARVSGRDARHYSPRKPLELVAPTALGARLAQLQGQALGVLAPAESLRSPAALASAGAQGRRKAGAAAHANLAVWIAAPDSPAQFAHDLYENLRRLDASDARRLVVAIPPLAAGWEAIHDRLHRAAAGSDDRLSDAD